MDLVKLIELFKATLDPSKVEAATAELDNIRKIATFLPSLLKIITDSNIEIAIRQAASVFFKNDVIKDWEARETKDGQLSYEIYKGDKDTLKGSIIDAIVLTHDERLRNALAVAIYTMVKHDFPEAWPNLVDQISTSLRTPEPNRVYGGLIVLLQLVKNYEYKNNTEKTPLINAMKLLCPIQYEMMTKLLSDDSEQSLLMQKTILKTFFTFVQYSLPLALFTQEFFTQWMEVFRQVLERPLPEQLVPQLASMEASKRDELPWFKAKKWTLHILVRVFERFGKPKAVSAEYKTFSKWYLETFSVGIIQVVLKTLAESFPLYYPGRIQQQCINYLNYSIPHNQCWKILKPHISQMVSSVIFPLMCYTDEDDELWNDDPQEYIRRKFDMFEEAVSTVGAAQDFLTSVCKRAGMLKNTIAFSLQVLGHGESTPRQRDGALNMLGTIAEQMLRNEEYRRQAGEMLATMVFPYFTCDVPFLRARAAWVLHFFDDYNFTNEDILTMGVNCLQNAMLPENDLPVKVEAAVSLNILIYSQPKARQLVEQNLRTVIINYLNIVKESQNEEVTGSLQKLIMNYGELVVPISQEIVKNLIDSVDMSNSGSTQAMFSAIDTVLMMIESTQVLQLVEPLVVPTIVQIFADPVPDMFEDAYNIITTLTSKYISPPMWEVYGQLYKLLMSQQGEDHFTDMMSCLHNFITVDPRAFLEKRERVDALFDMCKFELHYPYIEDVHINVIKIIEVFLLQYRQEVQAYMPSFIGLVVERYEKETRTDDLQLMCLSALVAAFYIDPQMLFTTLNNMQPHYPNKQLISHFLNDWLDSINLFCGVHDRKVCLLGLSTLLTMDIVKTYPDIAEKGQTMVMSMLKLFQSLKESYKLKAKAENESESDEGTSYYESESDGEEIDEEDDNGMGGASDAGAKLKQCFNAREMDEDELETDSDTDYDDDFDDEYQNEMTSLETYETSLEQPDSAEDEYIAFRTTIERIQNSDPHWYETLFGRLGESEVAVLHDIFVLAQQRKDAYESRKIERGGGYAFNPTGPINFNFGGSMTPQQQQQQQQPAQADSAQQHR